MQSLCSMASIKIKKTIRQVVCTFDVLVHVIILPSEGEICVKRKSLW